MPVAHENLATRHGAAIGRSLCVTTLGYAVLGLVAAWLYCPRVPYADQWRHYARLLTQPFAHAVLAAENGHVEVLPNLLRLADLRWCDGHELLQIACGMLLAIATALLLLRLIRRERPDAGVERHALGFVAVFAVFWLGNAHALTVVGDFVHVYLVILCLVLALALVLGREQPGALRVGGAGALCMLAALSFGSGLASFGAVLVLLILQRARGAALGMLAALALGALVYLALPGTLHQPEAGALAPLRSAQTTLQVLGAPFMYLFWPLLDPSAAAAVPGPLRGVALACAEFWMQHMGDIRSSAMPQAGFGAMMIALTAWRTLRAARRDTPALVRFGLALAWFGIACAALVALARVDYFQTHPDQVYALRYLPWTNLGWCGLLLASIAQARRPGLAVYVAMLLPLLALPSEFGLLRLAQHVRDVADDIALSSAVGVIAPEQALGENQLDDIRSARPALRDSHTAMFAWPAAAALGRSLPVGATQLRNDGVDVDAVVNQLGGDGSRLRARISGPLCTGHAMVVTDGIVVGVLRERGDGVWSGYAAAESTRDFSFYALCN